MSQLEAARNKYIPKTIKILFVAEAPPEDISRFFYYENIKNHDWLFLNLIRCLYPSLHSKKVAYLRKNKSKLLAQFQKDGYFLIDAIPKPISLSLSNSKREMLVWEYRNQTLEQIKQLSNQVILIKSTVYDGLYDFLHKEDTIKILNQHKIPFPSFGQQKNFHGKLEQTLLKCDDSYRLRRKMVKS